MIGEILSSFNALAWHGSGSRSWPGAAATPARIWRRHAEQNGENGTSLRRRHLALPADFLAFWEEEEKKTHGRMLLPI